MREAKRERRMIRKEPWKDRFSCYVAQSERKSKKREKEKKKKKQRKEARL